MRGRGRGRTAEERPETGGIDGRVWVSGSAGRARKLGTGRGERWQGGGAGQRRCGMGRWAGPGEGRAVRTEWRRGVAARRRGQD